MNHDFQKALTEFLPLTYSKEKKTDYLAGLCAQQEGSKIICYHLSPQMLQALLKYKPARLLAVAHHETKEQKKIAAGGKHMISFEGALSDIQDRVFDTAVFRPVSMLTEDLEPLIDQAQRLVRPGGRLIFLGDQQEKMFASLIKHHLTESGFSQICFLSDQDYSYVSCVKEAL